MNFISSVKKLNIFLILWYGLNIAVLYLWIIPTVSAPIYTKCVRYRVCSRFLHSSGWPFYYLVDMADGQWRDIRGNLPLLWAALLGVSALHFALRYYCRSVLKLQDSKVAALKSSWFRVVVGVVFLFVLHRWHMYIVLVLCLVTFQLAVSLRGARGSIAITWMFALAILALKETYRWQHIIDMNVSEWVMHQTGLGAMRTGMHSVFIVSLIFIMTMCCTYTICHT